MVGRARPGSHDPLSRVDVPLPWDVADKRRGLPRPAPPSPTATTHDLAESVLQTLWNNDQYVWRYVIESVPDTEELVFLNVDVSDNSGTGDSWSVRDSINQQIRSLTGDGWRVVSCQGEPS